MRWTHLPFHVKKSLNDAIDTVRKEELAKARKTDDTELADLLRCKKKFILMQKQIAERLNYFDVSPTIKPNPIAVGGDAPTMIRADIKAEEEAITLYKTIIKQAASEGDETTRLLFEEILSEEEDHHDTFTTLLG